MTADTRRIATGKLETLDNQIDVATGTLKLKARFDNADDALFPEPVRQCPPARDHAQDATAIPIAAVQQGSAGAFVFLVQDDDTVAVRSSWAPSTTAWWRSTRACSPATGS